MQQSLPVPALEAVAEGKAMRYLSVCSGIEAATVAWHPLGWEPVGFSEIDKFPSAVLAHHYPDVPNYGDMTEHEQWPETDVDVLVGGTPCQSFSVAGLRAGMADPRGNLALTYLAIADERRPRWLVWENVPGVLSSNDGRDFGAFLGALGQLGYGWAYRVLDAQYFGLAQRRRRVFVVGCLGDWRRAAAVLFDAESVSGNPAPRREAGQDTAPTFAARTRGGGGNSEGQRLTLSHDPACALTAREYKGSLPEADLSTVVACFDETQTTSSENRSTANPDTAVVAIRENQRGEVAESDQTNALSSGGGKPGQGYAAARVGMQVRRLTPTECERLQGFPDGYTRIAYRGKSADKCPDGPRYKALGNSMAVPVMRWIGERIQLVEDTVTESKQ